MLLAQLKAFLSARNHFTFTLPDGTEVPGHFHVTEVGEVNKTFVDCGGTLRTERRVCLQLWSADDYDHRLAPEKLVRILEMAEDRLGLGNWPVEVEYQGDRTIEKFGLDAREDALLLTGQITDCLAKDNCGMPSKTQVSLSAYTAQPAAGCTPGGGCC